MSYDIEEQAMGHIVPNDDPNQTRTIRSIIPVSSQTNSGVFNNSSNSVVASVPAVDSVNLNSSELIIAGSAVASAVPQESANVSRRGSVHSNHSAAAASQPVPQQAWTRSVDESGEVVYNSASNVAVVASDHSRKSSVAVAATAAPVVVASRKPSAAQSTSSSHYRNLSNTEVSNRIALDLIELIRSSSNSSQLAAAMATLSHHSGVSAAVALPPPNSSQRFSFASASALTQPQQILSDVEAAILRSSEPVNLNELDEIEVLGQRGIWANKAEVLNWRGIIPISEYRINEDATPEIITKRSQQTIQYIQGKPFFFFRSFI